MTSEASTRPPRRRLRALVRAHYALVPRARRRLGTAILAGGCKNTLCAGELKASAALTAARPVVRGPSSPGTWAGGRGRRPVANRRLGKMWGRSRVPVARPLWRDRGAWRPAPAAHLGQRSAPRVRSATPARTCSPPNPDNCRRRRRPSRTAFPSPGSHPGAERLQDSPRPAGPPSLLSQADGCVVTASLWFLLYLLMVVEWVTASCRHETRYSFSSQAL